VSHRSAAATGRQDDRGWSRFIGLDVEPGRFFEGANVAWRIAPFVVAGILPFALGSCRGALFRRPARCDRRRDGADHRPLGPVRAVAAPPRLAQAILPLAYFVVLVLLREGGGGNLSIFDPLLSIPVTWFAIYGTGRELAASIVGMALALLLPDILSGTSIHDEQLQRAIVANWSRLDRRSGGPRPRPGPPANDQRAQPGRGELSQGLR